MSLVPGNLNPELPVAPGSWLISTIAEPGCMLRCLQHNHDACTKEREEDRVGQDDGSETSGKVTNSRPTLLISSPVDKGLKTHKNYKEVHGACHEIMYA